MALSLRGRIRSFFRAGPSIPEVSYKDPQARVRANSRAVWNEWVGGWRVRERIFAAFALGALVLCIIEALANFKEAGKPSIPPAVIFVDGYGQVRDVIRPTESAMPDIALRHFLSQEVSDIFATSTLASAMGAQYERARTLLVPGGECFLTVQRYWDRYSPLRKMHDGTLQIPNPPQQTVEIKVTSYLPQGTAPNGDLVWELQWTATPRNSDGTDGADTLYRGRLAFTRKDPPAGSSDDVYIANPFGIQIDDCQWDQVQ
jgi:type IV secretory pathway TrbF-like protein